MKPGERIYNKETDKQWSSQVYHKAKEVIGARLSKASGAVRYDYICEAVKQQYPSLCDDTIKDAKNPQLPYWKHLVASAIQGLKKEGKINKADNGWIWKGVKLEESAEKGKVETPRLTHDELVQKVKEIGEMLGKIAEVKWGPKFEYDCVWKDNPFASPKLVIEVCDKGNLYKDITSLDWAVTTWGAKGIWVIFDDSDFHKAKEMLAQKSQIYPIKAEDMLKLHSLLQSGYAQVIRSIFAV
ncbi:MAG: hypothetical protein MUO61_03735 [Dehalococcoidia bacterium]|nr:hypothetical protein [Dehalococcoidia bacterium]